MSQTQKIRDLKRKYLGKLSAILVSATLLYWIATYTQLLEVASESLEGVHYLLIRKSASINRGDIVAIQGHKPQYLEGSYIFTKRAIALPGDEIVKTKNNITIKAKNGAITTIYPLLKYTKEGQVLTPLSISVVPEGYLFVVGDHLRSFDSRYEEFGLVPMDKIYGKALVKW